MRRFHLVEVEDQPWFPASARDTLTDFLQFMVSATRPYTAILPRLRTAVERAGATRIVDLGSGAGGPWLTLHADLPPGVEILLTDRYPNLPAWKRAAAVTAGRIGFYPEPVAATRVPAALTGFRTLFAAFHHFPPDAARLVLADAVAQRQGVAVVEATQRSVAALAIMLLTPLIVLLATPFIRPFRLSRLFWTYLLPVAPLAVLFDGMVSCFRTYTLDELRALVAAVPGAEGYEWEFGEERDPRAPLPLTYLIGCPVADRLEPERRG
jgi:hypothetical protein